MNGTIETEILPIVGRIDDLDIKLPIDGLEVTKQIKNDSRTKTVPLVVLALSSEGNPS